MENQIFEDIACTLCGCVCDDLSIRLSENKVIEAHNACRIAEPWFRSQAGSNTTTAAKVDGQSVDISTAIQRAAKILAEAKSPLIYGLSRSSTPGQRAAVRLADQLGANIDTTASTCHAPSIVALQNVGESTSSLGEVKNRSDLVIYWGSNPIKSHPRHIEKYIDAPGLLVPRGRRDRHLAVVDVEPTESSALADTMIQLEPGGDFEFVWALRSLLAGQSLNIDSAGGVSLDHIKSFAKLLTSHRYVAIFFGLGVTNHGVPHANVEALLCLATDLNAHTRAIIRRMRVPGDVAGADSVLCWQTGFPFSVNLNRGYPRYNPGEYTAQDLLRRGEVDAVLMVGSEGVAKFDKKAQLALTKIPTIALDYPDEQNVFSADVQFTTAIYGVHQPGTAYRMDEIPIPLRSFLPSNLSSDEQILQRISSLIDR